MGRLQVGIGPGGSAATPRGEARRPAPSVFWEFAKTESAFGCRTGACKPPSARVGRVPITFDACASKKEVPMPRRACRLGICRGDGGGDTSRGRSCDNRRALGPGCTPCLHAAHALRVFVPSPAPLDSPPGALSSGSALRRSHTNPPPARPRKGLPGNTHAPSGRTPPGTSPRSVTRSVTATHPRCRPPRRRRTMWPSPRPPERPGAVARAEAAQPHLPGGIGVSDGGQETGASVTRAVLGSLFSTISTPSGFMWFTHGSTWECRGH